MEIRNETIDRVMAYLTVQQWNKVEGLIHEISDQIAAVQNEAARVAEDAKVKAIEARLKDKK